MSTEKRYYWLKLKEDFFSSKRIKKLRKLAGGDTYTIIYLKMQLLAMKNNGMIEYAGLEPTFAEELALDIDEEPDDVAVTIGFLVNTGLAETSDSINYFFPYAVENVGSEGASAQRMREARAKLKTSAVTDGEQCSTMCELRYGERDIEKEIEIDIEREPDKTIDDSSTKKSEDERGRPRNLKECTEYFVSEKLKGDPAMFCDYYRATNWTIGGMPITDWKAVARNWSRREAGFSSGKKSSPNKVMTAAEYEEKHKNDVPDFSGLISFCKENGVEVRI